jgi:hypothetical protein
MAKKAAPSSSHAPQCTPNKLVYNTTQGLSKATISQELSGYLVDRNLPSAVVDIRFGSSRDKDIDLRELPVSV